MDSKMKCILALIFLGFCWIRAAKLGHEASKTPQDAAQDGREAAQETPKTAQEPPKSCLNGLQEAAQRCLGARSRPRAAQEVPKGRTAPLPDLIFLPFC